LQTHRLSLGNRIGSNDRGVFKQGHHCRSQAVRRPSLYDDRSCHPCSASTMFYSPTTLTESKFGTDVVLNIKDQDETS
jgi:hypothetical protein